MATDDLAPHQHELPTGRRVALGRPNVKVDDRTFRLASFLIPSALPALPDRIVNSDKVSPWPMFANDRLGDCADAGIAHGWQLLAALSGQTESYTDDDVIGLYSKQAGYSASDPSTDRGSILLDVLNYLRRTPFGDDKILAFATLDLHDVDLVRHAIQLFGFVYAGVSLPRSAQAQDGSLWDDTDHGPNGEPNSWGGHCIITTDYDFTTDHRTFGDITWGGVQSSTLAFRQRYHDEGYVILTEEWRQKAPAGFALDVLDHMLAQLGHVD